MARRSFEEAVAALVALASRHEGGDPLRDEPAFAFRPLEPEPADADRAEQAD